MSKQDAKKEAIQTANQLSSLLETYIGSEVQISFGPHSFDVVLSEVGYATLGSVKTHKHKITPIVTSDGTIQNPQHIIIHTETGESLILQANRVKSRVTANGLQLVQENGYTLTITKKRGK